MEGQVMLLGQEEMELAFKTKQDINPPNTDFVFHSIIANSIPELWFLAVKDILRIGKEFGIDKGSFSKEEGYVQSRYEFDYFLGRIKFPQSKPVIPVMRPGFEKLQPTTYDYVFEGLLNEDGTRGRSYISYLMTSEKSEKESYTYGSRLNKYPITGEKLGWLHFKDGSIIDLKVIEEAKERNIIIQEKEITGNVNLYVNQIEWVIYVYSHFGYRNNQMVLNVAHPSDCLLKDPPCLRHIDTRIQNGKLYFFVYFRSWDIFQGLPSNLAAIQYLQEYMAHSIGVECGEMFVESKGAHIYGYSINLALELCNL